MCYHTERNLISIQSCNTDTKPTSLSTDLTTPGALQDKLVSYSCLTPRQLIWFSQGGYLKVVSRPGRVAIRVAVVKLVV